MKDTNTSLHNFGRLAAVLLAGTLILAPAHAQDSAGGLEEIIVTAQKRPQALMQVPVSITVVNGAEIAASGIKDMFDMQQNVPGLIVGQSQTTTSSNFAIRGIGSTSNNFGVESSVGLYIDNVYRSRQSAMVGELIDVEAVEILRGPQGTLFGKNTSSGAILMRTVAPSRDETNGFIDLTVGDYGLTRLSAAANFNMGDNGSFRGTVFTSQRDGYVSDLNLGEDLYNNRDRLGLRAQFALNEPSDDFNMRIILDYSEIDEHCCVAITRVDGLFSQASLAAFPNVVPGTDAALAQIAAALQSDGAVAVTYPYPDALLAGFGPYVVARPFEDYQVAYNYLPESRNTDSGISVEFNKALGNMTLSSITAFRSFDTYDLIDADFSVIDIFERVNDVSISSFSQEFRLSGDFGEGSFFQVGLYYFGQEIDQHTETNGGALLETYVLAVQPDLVLLINGVNAVSAATGGALPPAASPFPMGMFADEDIVQDHDAWAVFGQVEFALSDRAVITIGGRYTDEKKSITGVFTQTGNGPPPDLDAIGLQLFYAATMNPLFDPTPLFAVMEPNAGWGGYLFDPLAPRPGMNEELTDDQFTGTAKIAFDATDDVMLYASYSTGFKSGGTNTDRINVAFDPLFGPETSTSAEIGLKANLGNARIGFSYYQTDYDDFQANSFTGVGFNLQNAGKIETNGWELEYIWAPTDTLQITGYFAKSEGDFTEFLSGTCWDAYVFHTLTPDPGQNPDGASCDRSGGKIPYNPEDRAFVAITKDFPIAAGNLFIRGEYTYASDFYTDGDLDPFALADSLSLVNLRIGMDIDSWNSQISLWGRNITDERYYHGSFDPPIQTTKMNSYPGEPATYGISFSKSWD